MTDLPKDGGDDNNPILVLIAEDDEPIALALSFVIEDAGYTPLLATNGKEALELARTRWPALIITDLMMPHMSGQEFIAALRLDTARHLPPIIVMSAADRAYTRDLGADAILSKPFDIRIVDALLQRFLASKKTTQ